ncbi:MBL fold metallo-hydrolase [Caldanaerobacter subterraneus]|uniref:MBL fold metallo-hydrolase n=1 Tax=Caldanaerobacter subterraneus TaxID=911092 RepID=UPI003B969844
MLFDIKDIDFVLLTHAHIDHSGGIKGDIKREFMLQRLQLICVDTCCRTVGTYRRWKVNGKTGKGKELESL